MGLSFADEPTRKSLPAVESIRPSRGPIEHSLVCLETSLVALRSIRVDVSDDAFSREGRDPACAGWNQMGGWLGHLRACRIGSRVRSRRASRRTFWSSGSHDSVILRPTATVSWPGASNQGGRPMAVPGFTADASVSDSARRYSAPRRHSRIVRRPVHPALDFHDEFRFGIPDSPEGKYPDTVQRYCEPCRCYPTPIGGFLWYFDCYRQCWRPENRNPLKIVWLPYTLPCLPGTLQR